MLRAAVWGCIAYLSQDGHVVQNANELHDNCAVLATVGEVAAHKGVAEQPAQVPLRRGGHTRVLISRGCAPPAEIASLGLGITH